MQIAPEGKPRLSTTMARAMGLVALMGLVGCAESGPEEGDPSDAPALPSETSSSGLAIGGRCTAPSLALGDNHSCLVRPGGAVACWGLNGSRQLGVATPSRSTTPADVPGVSGAIAVTAGSGHTCALLADGTVWCWGANGSGQLGSGAVSRYGAPAAVAGLAGITAIASGTQHTCALRNDGTVWCWGSNGSGRLGDGTTTRRPRPVQVRSLTNVTAIAAGGQHTCALSRVGEAYCWGANGWGQLGDGTRATRTRPVLVSGGGTWRSLAAGQLHTCGVRQSAGNGVECWGKNTAGQLGDGTIASYRTAPVAATASDGTPLTDGVMVAAGGSATCLIRGSGGAACWGADTQGQLGDGAIAPFRRTAVDVTASAPLAGAFLLVARGVSHTCALALTGEPYCWGYNYYGQLGDGTRTRHLVPTRSGSMAGLTFANFAAEDDFAADSGSAASSVVGFGDTLLVAGLAHDAASDAWIVRRSVDRGANWTTFASYTSGGDMQPPHLARLDSGTLFLAGAADDDGSTAWLVRRSSDGGDTWESLAPYVFDRARPASLRALATDSAGRLFAAGSADDAAGTRWLVRGSADGGSTWFTADDYAPAGGAVAHAVLDAGSAGHLVLGHVVTGGHAHLHLRRATALVSEDHATAWSDADDFVHEAGYDTIGESLALDLSGRIFALARADGADGWRWVLRSSTDGATWATVSTFQLATGVDTEGHRLLVDRAGVLHVLGAAERWGSVHGVLASSYDHGATWVLSDELGSTSTLTDVAEDSTGALHTVGAISGRWSVRSRTCLGLSPSCGNWVIDPGELCDGDCSDCDDHDACTTDAMQGSPATCDVICTNTPVTACVSGDGCCAPGCSSAEDLDCCTGPIENGACVDESFKLDTLTLDGCQAAEHSQITGAGRGGLAVSSTDVFYTGAGATSRGLTGRFSATSLGEGRATSYGFENIFSDLRTGAVYVLGTGTVPLARAGAVTTLIPLDLATGQPTTPRVALSRSIVIAASRVLFSGYGRLVLFSGARVYDVQLSSGQVTDLGSMSLPSHNTCPNLGAWGVAESFDGGLFVTYASNAAILRTRVPSGATETLHQFTDLGGTCALGYSVATRRWYFEHAGASEVASGVQTLVSCEARMRRPQAPGVCGDGIIEAGETCDGDCPASCADGDACTTDQVSGSVSSCNLTCGHAAVTSCASGDGCCPSGCNAAADDDCTPVCGNGVVEPGETCDGDCPASCDDGNTCSADHQSGLAMSCNMACTHAPVTACLSGDGCCPAGCSANDDHDCSVTCGNGLVEAGETCDGNCPASCSDGDACTTDVATGSASTCSAGCTHTPITACQGGDGCCPSGCNGNTDSDCGATCGNGVVEPGETCDGNCPTSCNDGDACTADSFAGSSSTCNQACVHQPVITCTSGDGCCPAGCTFAQDDDCPPVPVLSSLSPSQVTEGAGTTVLTLIGSGFVAGAEVSLDGVAQATTRVSGTELRVTLSAAALASAASHTISVATGGGTSAALAFTVNHATPSTSGLVPSSATTGAASFPMTVAGSAFVSGAVVSLNGLALSTTFVSASELVATVPGSALTTPGTYGVTVQNPSPTLGASAPLSFTVNYGTPSVSGLTPAAVTVASGAFTLTVAGASFAPGAVVSFGGTALSTTFVTSGLLHASVPAGSVATAGSYAVTVANPAPTVGASAAVTFTVNHATPTLGTLTPASVTAGASAFTLTISGASFLSGAVVTFDGAALSTTFVSATEVQASVPASAVAAGGSYLVEVTNPSPTAGASAALTFTANHATPTLSLLTPASAEAGASALTLTIDGGGFVSGAVASLDGGALATTWVSSSRLTATVPANMMTAAATRSVTVSNPTPTLGASGALTFTINNAAPTVLTATPASVTAGDASFTLTLDGTAFVSGAIVSFNGAALATTYVSATRLTATVPAASVAVGGVYSITAANPAPNAGTSAAFSYTVNNPTPTISTLTPASATAGAATFTLTVAGTSFLSGAVVSFNGTALATTYVSATSLRATVSASLVASGGTYGVTVANPTPRVGSSNSLTFTVNNGTPAITTLTPASVTLGASSFTLTIDGSGFLSGAVATFGGTALSTTFVSTTRLTATVPAASVATAGTRNVTVANAAPTVGSSGALTFTVNNPTPSLTTTTPSSVTAGAATFTLTVNGTSFVSGAVVTFNGTALTTTYVSSSQVTASVPAASVAAAGLYNVTAANPTPRLGSSAALTFTVNNAAPTVSTLTPSTVGAGSGAFTLTVAGSGFVSGAVVSFNGTALTTTFVSSAQLTAAVPASSVTAAGTYAVIATNPAPNLGPSGSATFTVAGGGACTSNASWSQVRLLLHMDGTAGSTTFTDSRAHTIANSGSPTLATSGRFSQGGYFASGYLTMNSASDLTLGTSDFTLEFFVSPNGSSYPGFLLNAFSQTGNYGAIAINEYGGIYFDAGGGWDYSVQMSATSGAWTHVAISRVGGNIYIFQNGSPIGTFAVGSRALVSGTYNTIGAYFTGATGTLDEVRLVIGTGLYTTSFTPPTTRFCDY